MSSNESLKHGHVLLISQQMDWNHAFLRGLQRGFVVHDRSCDQVWQVDDLLKESLPDIVVIVTGETDDIRSLHKKLARLSVRVPLMVVTANDANEVIRAGADYCVRPEELLGAIKYAGASIESNRGRAELGEIKEAFGALKQLNNALYHSSPDPVCYVQDGLFMDANPAFLRCFAIEDMDALNDLTLLSLATLRSEKQLKTLLRTTANKSLTTSETLDMETLSGEKKSLLCTASNVEFHGEPAIQLLWREENQGGGGAVSSDKTTGLMGFPALQQLLAHERKEKSSAESIGVWIFLWLENYRDVWAQDSYEAAEMMIRCVAEAVGRYFPSSLVATRFNDDTLILYAEGERHAAIERMEKLLKQVQSEVPEGVSKMVHPVLYAMVDIVTPQSTDNQLLTNSFRSVKALSLGQGQDHLTTGGNAKLSRNDERRLQQLQSALDEQRMKVKYLPISHLEADGVPRFGIQLDIELDPEKDDDIELDTLLAVAERQDKSKVLDELKLNTFIRDVLCFSGDQRSINGYVKLSGQSLQDSAFSDWILNQLKQTGVMPTQITFEIPVDTALNTFSQTLSFAEKMRKNGSHVAISELGRFDDDIKELLGQVKPDVLKLDMHEIDTFEDDEEVRFMNAVKEYTGEHGMTIIVDHMESPAQLSRVWPYDLQLLQGEGMVAALDDFNYDFSEPLF